MKKINLKNIDEIRKTGFRPQVVGCFINDHKILFLYKKKYDLWQLPQGGIDNKEDIETAIKREMTEELGRNFASNIKEISVIGENELEFPPHAQNTRELKTDEGEEIFMKGKKYFLIAINTTNSELNIDETEFNDHQWLNYEEALDIAENIHQTGKQRIIVDTLVKLHDAKLI